MQVWDVFGRAARGGVPETLLQSGGVMCLAFSPRGQNVLAVGGEGGRIALWDPGLGDEGLLTTIDCLRDIQGGRTSSDRVAKNAWTTASKRVSKVERRVRQCGTVDVPCVALVIIFDRKQCEGRFC